MNADGTITYVISMQDPGVHNWLDTGGIAQGIFAIRWQDVPATLVDADVLVLETKVVLLSQLPDVLPANTQRLTKEQRAEQRQSRRHSFERRLQ